MLHITCYTIHIVLHRFAECCLTFRPSCCVMYQCLFFNMTLLLLRIVVATSFFHSIVSNIIHFCHWSYSTLLQCWYTKLNLMLYKITIAVTCYIRQCLPLLDITYAVTLGHRCRNVTTPLVNKSGHHCRCNLGNYCSYMRPRLLWNVIRHSLYIC